jgi:hypothetical protein
VMENALIHVEQSEKSGLWIYVDDGSFRRPHVVRLRHAWQF